MKKYELSLSENYVSDWGVVEAVREIFQNAADQEITYSNNEMFHQFMGDTLMIGNKSSVLNVESLLLGETSKRDDNSTVGKFGEGYKLALLVLTRLGKPVTIYNYGAREVWTPKLRTSARYNGVKTLQIEIQDKYIWQRVPHSDLIYQIGGLTENERKAIVQSNLRLQEVTEGIETTFGTILLDPEQKGRIYVNGLFVSVADEFFYGYDFKPEHIQLDRDRRMIHQFDLQWCTSSMWKESGSDQLIELTRRNAKEVSYLRGAYIYRSASKFEAVANKAFDSFRAEHGDKALPVTTHAEMLSVLRRKGGLDKVTPIIVPEAHRDLLQLSSQYEAAVAALPLEEDTIDPARMMYNFYYQVCDKLSGDDLTVLWNLILRSQNWREMECVRYI